MPRSIDKEMLAVVARALASGSTHPVGLRLYNQLNLRMSRADVLEVGEVVGEETMMLARRVHGETHLRLTFRDRAGRVLRPVRVVARRPAEGQRRRVVGAPRSTRSRRTRRVAARATAAGPSGSTDGDPDEGDVADRLTAAIAELDAGDTETADCLIEGALEALRGAR